VPLSPEDASLQFARHQVISVLRRRAPLPLIEPPAVDEIDDEIFEQRSARVECGDDLWQRGVERVVVRRNLSTYGVADIAQVSGWLSMCAVLTHVRVGAAMERCAVRLPRASVHS
jgi:hypothetical protein